MGLFGTDDSKSPFSNSDYQQYDPTKDAAAERMRQANGAAEDPAFRQGQLGLVQDLQRQAAGQGPSLVGQQLAQAQDTNAKTALGLAASTRAAQNPGLALQATQAQLAQSGQEAARAAAQAKIAERLAAQQQLSGVLAQGRGGDLGVAGLQQGNSQFNAGQFNQALLNDINNQNQRELAQNQQIAGYQTQQAQQDALLRNQVIGAGLSAGSALAGHFATSDKNAKKNIKPGDRTLRAFLDALSPSEYEYKDTTQPGTSEGKHVSVMAQDLESTPVGKVMVVEAPHGKMVDYGKALPIMLAAAADAHARLKKLEAA